MGYSETEKVSYIIIKSSPPKVFIGKGVLKICGKFTGEHPCRSVMKSHFSMGVLL